MAIDVGTLFRDAHIALVPILSIPLGLPASVALSHLTCADGTGGFDVQHDTCSLMVVALQVQLAHRDREGLQVRSSVRAVLAGGGVVVSVGAGVVTNLVTDKWSWSLAILLAGLVICGAVVAGRQLWTVRVAGALWSGNVCEAVAW